MRKKGTGKEVYKEKREKGEGEEDKVYQGEEKERQVEKKGDKEKNAKNQVKSNLSRKLRKMKGK